MGEGQAQILLGDLQAYQAQLCREAGHDVDESTAARLWVIEVLTPYEQLAHDVVNHKGTPIQAYCDLLEVRWLLSEQAGHDVGTNKALAALARDVIPTDSAAKMAIAEVPTAPFEVLQDRRLIVSSLASTIGFQMCSSHERQSLRELFGNTSPTS